jgi:hypothetical protein
MCHCSGPQVHMKWGFRKGAGGAVLGDQIVGWTQKRKGSRREVGGGRQGVIKASGTPL